MGYSLKRLSIFHKSVLKNVKYVYICFFFFLEKVKILSCEFQLPGTNSHCVSTAVAFLVFLICLVDQMILLIGIVTSVLPIIDSFVFEANMHFVEIWQWRDRTKQMCELIMKRIDNWTMELFTYRYFYDSHCRQVFSAYFHMDMEMSDFHATTYGATLLLLTTIQNRRSTILGRETRKVTTRLTIII